MRPIPTTQSCTGNTKTAQPRWGVRKQDAPSCMAVVLPFVPVPSTRQRGEKFYRVDRRVAPVQFVPLLSLGCRIEMGRCWDESASESQYYSLSQRELAGGTPLHSMRLSWGMFGASAMRAEGVGLHLTALKVKQLQEELGVRGATKSGRKRALQLRLRALIIAAAAEREGTEPEAVEGDE
jgi:hypothetical protein